MAMELSIVIPAYNATGQVEPLLNQLLALGAGRPWEIIVADDASPDGTAQHLRERYPQIAVVANSVNGGFGANSNSGAARAGGEYLALINTDVDLAGDPLTPLVELLRARPDVFAAMPLIYNTSLRMVENIARLYCHRGLCWHTEKPEQHEWTKLLRPLHGSGDISRWPAHTDPDPLEAVLCGATFVCRTAEFNALGGFDPRYRPFYWEDVDLGYKALARGQSCATVQNALVLHRHSETINRKVGERKLRHLIMNQLRFVQAHSGQLRAAGLRHKRWWWLARAGRCIGRGDWTMAGAFLRAALGLRP